MIRVYIAGPMTGYDKLNFPAFDAARKMLEAEGVKPISPAQLDDCFGHNDSQMDFTIRRDLEAIMQSDAIYALKGWERSVGARAEHALAVWRGITIRYQTQAEIDANAS